MPRERREQQILDVAGAIFARSGYHQASMDDIADAAGVSKPMLYAYFGSKEGLYLAYIERAGRDLEDRLVGASIPDLRPASLLRTRISEFLAFVDEHSDGWRVLFREVGSTQPIAEHVAELRERIAQAIRWMINDAELGFEPLAADAVAHALVGAGESLANWWLDHPEVTRDEAANWYLAVVRPVLASRGYPDAVPRSPGRRPP
jgi:AcrR family transcriptional regulator